MKLLLPAAPAFALLLALAAGCTSGPAPLPPAQGEPLLLTDADNGRTVTAARGQEIRLTLASNPSTGYSWSGPEIANPTVVRFVSLQYVPPAQARPGAGGAEEYVFRATAAGRATVALTYRRRFDPQDNPTRFSVNVNVESAAAK